MSPQESGRTKGSAISRVLEIIEAVSEAQRPPSPADLAFLLDIPKPSIHRLLQQLQAEGYVQVNMRGLVVPGERMVTIARGVLYTSRHKALRQAILRRLSAEVDETCGISIPDGLDMVYYDRVQSHWPLQIHLPNGSLAPVWCTASGKLYLSSMSKARRSRIIGSLPLERMTRRTLTDPATLEHALQDIARTELGVDDEEFIAGMVAVSVPIKDAQGRSFAYLYVHAPTLRKSIEDLRACEPAMRRAAQDLAVLIEAPEGEDEGA
ncbi:transcriptional regulator, IclR family [Pseudoxanthomonas sp. GM95]|uniref:IclR family transcriptional regulator n=1 Tax=Pseudoxanthomonas sp. GM95 TaxID=1881043 RepID=UPI0008B0257F|nr:IclR family transcriptional regulator [Pseudoxanthomonas sp. GM95]SEK41303.1 transcriptional regulator, IclR family [Pseudoxanthomonas sp. GM95]